MADVKSIRSKLRDYLFNKVEFGKLLVIASIALLVFSSQSVMQLRSNHEQVKEIQKELEAFNNRINSREFNQSLKSLEDIESTSIGEDISEITKTYRAGQNSFSELSEVEEQLKESYRNYQWVFLSSILGIVAGVAVMAL